MYEVKSFTLLVTHSGNSKLGDMAATYAPIAYTCPSSCALRDKGCYAQGSYVGIHNARLEKLSRRWRDTALTIARREASEVREYGPRAKGRPLRLHVSGDARTAACARALGGAARQWDGPVYTYTHAWRDVARYAWGDALSVLASCETVEDARKAISRGYAPAVVVSRHPTDGRTETVGDLRLIPCPSQTRGVTCDQCRLCMRDTYLRDNRCAITFAVHGASKKRALTVIK